MKLSSDTFHMTIVPPLACVFSMAFSDSNLSTEFNSQLYSPLNRDMQLVRSERNIWGSEIKIKSGLIRLDTLFRQKRFLFSPSMFQESDVRVIVGSIDEKLASTGNVELSGLLSLTGGGQYCQHGRSAQG